jgi:hypothetical protein
MIANMDEGQEDTKIDVGGDKEFILYVHTDTLKCCWTLVTKQCAFRWRIMVAVEATFGGPY